MDDSLHKATIEIFSRGNSRKGSWSTKRVREAMQELGFDIQGMNPDGLDNQIIQVITITGNRNQIIAQRDAIARKLKGIAGCKVPSKFNLVY